MCAESGQKSVRREVDEADAKGRSLIRGMEPSVCLNSRDGSQAFVCGKCN